MYVIICTTILYYQLNNSSLDLAIYSRYLKLRRIYLPEERGFKMQEIPSDVQIWASPVKLIEFSLEKFMKLYNKPGGQKTK